MEQQEIINSERFQAGRASLPEQDDIKYADCQMICERDHFFAF